MTGYEVIIQSTYNDIDTESDLKALLSYVDMHHKHNDKQLKITDIITKCLT